MKKCNTCNIDKLLTDFYSQNKTKADGEKYTYYPPECKECTKKRAMKYQKDNPEKFKGYMKKENAKPSMKAAKSIISKEFRESGKYLEWQRNNKDKVKIYNEDRRNKNHSITKNEWEVCKEYFNHECAYCSLHISEHFNMFKSKLIWTDFHKEHVEHDGLNDITNCVPSCKLCNSTKGSMKLEEWYSIDNPVYSAERLKKIYSWLDSFNGNQDTLRSK